MTDTPTRTNAPTLQWAVRLLAFEALALAVFAIFVVWASVTGDATSATTRIATPAITILGVVILAGLARGLSHLKAWARGPAIVIEILLVPIGLSMINVGVGYAGVPVLIAGVLGAGLLLAPSTRTALGIDPYRDQ